MRFATYIVNDKEYAGVFYDGGFYSFSELLGSGEQTLLEFIRAYEGREIPDFARIIAENGLKPLSADSARLRAPFQPFRNVICLGKNYADHAKETVDTGLDTQGASMIPEKPVYFAKNANPAVGDGDTVPLHSHFTQKVDYEVELAVIIGKTAWRIAPGDVESHIFGYTVLNDITARDIQTAYGQWYFGKSLDCFCSIGPVIVTRDELPLPLKLDVSCRVNGVTRQKSNTSNLIYDIPGVISELSQGMKFFPGDIIATGTPGGIGHAMNPPCYLKNGDNVECEVEKIGVLANFFE